VDTILLPSTLPGKLNLEAINRQLQAGEVTLDRKPPASAATNTWTARFWCAPLREKIWRFLLG
jgi:hypothetical protein